MSDDESTPEVAKIEAKIRTWLQQNGNVLQLDFTNTPITFKPLQYARGIFSTTKDAPANVSMQILFDKDNLNENTTLEELRSSFTRASIDNLPLPGLDDIPRQWKLCPQTPISSFTDGVTFEQYDPSTQILQVTIQTKFFAVYGNIPQKHPIMDAPAPKGTYLQVRQDFQGDIQLNAKLDFSE